MMIFQVFSPYTSPSKVAFYNKTVLREVPKVLPLCWSPTKLGSLATTEDSTMKVWSLNDSQCKQSVVHAGTVWQVESSLDVFL